MTSFFNGFGGLGGVPPERVVGQAGTFVNGVGHLAVPLVLGVVGQ